MSPEEINRASAQADRQRELSANQGRLADALRESGLYEDAVEVVATVTAELELALRRSGSNTLALVPISDGCGFFLKSRDDGWLITPVVEGRTAGVRFINGHVDAYFSRPEAALEFVLKQLI